MKSDYDTLVPIQCFGIGDIIWEQTLVTRLAEGRPILWPVEPQFVEGLNRAYPNIEFIDKRLVPFDYNRKDEYCKDGKRFLPLRWADSIMGVPYSDCMKSKYMMYNMDWQGWKERAEWRRDTTKELQLAARLNLPKNFILVNRFFGSSSQFTADIKLTTDLPVIEMKVIEGFSLFDWVYLMERATEIHTVSTSIIYMLEVMELKAPEVHLYVRRPHEEDFRNIIYILQKHKYIQHI